MKGKILTVSVTIVVILLLLPTVSAGVSKWKRNTIEFFETKEDNKNEKVRNLNIWPKIGFGELLFALVYLLFLLLGIPFF